MPTRWRLRILPSRGPPDAYCRRYAPPALLPAGWREAAVDTHGASTRAPHAVWRRGEEEVVSRRQHACHVAISDVLSSVFFSHLYLPPPHNSSCHLHQHSPLTCPLGCCFTATPPTSITSLSSTFGQTHSGWTRCFMMATVAHLFSDGLDRAHYGRGRGTWHLYGAVSRLQRVWFGTHRTNNLPTHLPTA